MAFANKTYRFTSEGSTNAKSAVATDATLQGVVIANGSTETRYVKLYNLKVAPTLSSSVPVLVFAVPKESTVIETGFNEAFSAGIAHAITKKQIDNNEEAVAAADISLTISYSS